MSVLNPQDDAAALKPLIDAAVKEAISGLAQTVVPALGSSVQQALDGLTISITFSKKV